jgi:hypothetical protein
MTLGIGGNALGFAELRPARQFEEAGHGLIIQLLYPLVFNRGALLCRRGARGCEQGEQDRGRQIGFHDGFPPGILFVVRTACVVHAGLGKTLSQTMHSARESRLTGRAGRQSLSEKSPGGLMKFTTRLVLGAFAVAALALSNVAVP